ncbi:putative GATA transcription factor 22 [Nymphaea thermarum]|nr:putative GATA transcription factor 22 [Nymphaea thermarum]
MMLRPVGRDFFWGDGRDFTAEHDHQRFIPKELLLFDPTSRSQHPCTPIFFSQHEHHYDIQDQVGVQHAAGAGSSDHPTTCDHGINLDDSSSKTHITDGHHDHQSDYSQHEQDDHPRRCDRHRDNHLDQQRLSRECNSYNHPIRTCVDCNTTKTPLWRSGPLGPKSLCNACGIRHHKARRARAASAAAAAAAAAAQTGENCYSSPVKSKLKKEKRSEQTKSATNFKKRSKLFTTPRRRRGLCLDLDLNCPIDQDDNLQYPETPKQLDFSVEMSKPVPFKRVFPEDEEQAAILLMALSCGLVHG